MASYSGIAGRKRYTLGQQLANGGEGIVYELSGDSSHVAKIYRSDRFKSEAERSVMERKLRAMINMNVSATVDGLLRLAWPQDILYENGKIVGFIMPCITTKYKIFDVYRTGKNSIREKEYTNYTWKYSVQFAYNMAWVVNYLHRNNIVIGDLNQNNIAVDTKTGAVILIDCDSFDIRDPKTGEHFPCVVGLEEMLAPELQTVGSLRNGTFTKESDNFSLAIHIFRLLMNNEDPFGGAMTTNASQSNIPGNKAIINGECLYVRNVPGKKWLPRMPKLDILPPDIQKLFQKTFNYTATTALAKKNGRATAQEWVNALAVLSAAEPNPHLKKCDNNVKHVYPVHNTSCPWCDIEKAMKQPLPAVVPPKTRGYTSTSSTARTNTGGTSTGTSTGTNTGTSTSTRTAYAGRTVRRSATLFYIVLILFGVASGFIFGDTASRMVNDTFSIGMSSGVATAILSILGLISGIWLAHHYEDNYTHANNCIGWLFMGLLAAIIPLAIALVLGIVAAIVVAVVSLIISIIGALILLFCVCSILGGS